MKSNAYTLYDIKSETYSPPFFASAHGSAIRLVMDLVSDPTTTPGRHPQDFSLLCIGSFDDSLGLMLPLDNRQHIADCVSLLPRVLNGHGPAATPAPIDLTPGKTDPALKAL